MTSTTPGRSCLAIVLAAGEGKRMQSALPKVLHAVAGRSMLGHVLASVKAAGADAVAVVVGPGREDVAAEAALHIPAVEIFTQADRLGTAHAVLAARSALARGFDEVLVLFADTPLVRPETFATMRDALAGGAAVAALGFETCNPDGYGRLLTEDGELVAIREHKDASEEERKVCLCNAGLMALDGKRVLALLEAIGNDNAQKEYYLTDAVAEARAAGATAVAVTASETEVMGVNDRVQLAEAEAVMQTRLREAAMRGGVTLLAPETVYFSHDTQLGRDVVVEPNVFFGPGVLVADNATIRASSHLEHASVGPGATVGPFARLRPGAKLGEKAKVGNFVEIKAADIGPGAAVSHLTYIGDARVGAKANIGAGTITCNYDGYGKHITEIGAGAFVGSNSSLVAPVKIGDGAYVGSGSVVTKDVAPGALAVARGKQVEKAGWADAFRTKMAALKAKK
ncbi:MAG: bifunctional UDP-N-acetylglucosamine diphosphorylase/glucosamine-1-phosphate N-acetyltransferase GlmU [Beijerinckiaceae bacterium]